MQIFIGAMLVCALLACLALLLTMPPVKVLHVRQPRCHRCGRFKKVGQACGQFDRHYPHLAMHRIVPAVPCGAVSPFIATPRHCDLLAGHSSRHMHFGPPWQDWSNNAPAPSLRVVA